MLKNFVFLIEMSDLFTEEQRQWLTEFLAKATKPPDQQSSQPSTSLQSQNQSDYMLKEIVWPIFEVLFEDNVPHMHYQQDGAPAHYLRGVRDWLNETIGTKWIGRGGPLEWPAHSPDLTPVDFWLWGYLKEKVYAHNPKSVDELQVVIAQEMSALDPAMIQRVSVRCSYGLVELRLKAGGSPGTSASYVNNEVIATVCIYMPFSASAKAISVSPCWRHAL